MIKSPNKNKKINQEEEKNKIEIKNIILIIEQHY